MFVKPQQKKEDDQHGERFVKLRRMKVCVGGHTSDFMSQFRKLHTPWQVRGFAPATAGCETALPAKEISNSDPGSTSVGRLPPGKLVPAHQEVACQDCANQSAIKNST